MLMQSRLPNAALAPFVAVLWYQVGNAPSHAQERLLPDGSSELVIGLANEPLRAYKSGSAAQVESSHRSLVVGSHSEPFTIDAAYNGALIGVHFKAGGAYPFLGMPADEIRNLTVGLDDLWRSGADELRDKLLAAESVAARFDVLEAHLLTQLNAWRAMHAAVAFALERLHAAPTVSVAALANEIGMSQRRFIERFRNEVGLTPKKFGRVRRFQAVVQSLQGVDSAEIDWTNIALNCGYFDQAHFIHDFRRFSGLTPSAYLAQKGERFNHIPLV